MVSAKSLIALLLAWFVVTLAFANEKRIYTDPESFKSALLIGVVEERNLDINNDQKPDVIIYTTGGEEIYLDIFLKEEDHFSHLCVPVAEHYEVIGSPGLFELKIGRGTFPSYGDIHGSDKYQWYDFYEVVGHSLELRNSRHRQFYERMLSLYRKRIQELEDEVVSLAQQKSGEQADISTLELFMQFRRDHIERYHEFIERASAVIGSSKGT